MSRQLIKQGGCAVEGLDHCALARIPVAKVFIILIRRITGKARIALALCPEGTQGAFEICGLAAKLARQFFDALDVKVGADSHIFSFRLELLEAYEYGI
jgi:hypothetical protein